MTDVYGLKVSKIGKATSSTDIRDFILHTSYTMFKIHTISSGSITINAGSQTGYVDISHDLGYVPAFLVYEGGTLLPTDIVSYADSSKIRITRNLDSPYGYVTHTWGYADELWDDFTNATTFTNVGNYSGNSCSSAMRFAYVPINQGATIVSANTEHRCHNRGVSSPPQNLEFRTYGMDQDNCDAWGSSQPMTRDKTTAVTDQSNVVVNIGENFGTNVKDQVQEIINRNGWDNGNDIGFMVIDDGTPSGNYVISSYQDDWSHNLSITVNNGGSTTTNYKVVVFKDKIE